MEHTFYRRLLSAVCAIALAFTAVCPAVAAAPEDTTGTPQTLTVSEVQEMQQTDAAVTALTDSAAYAGMSEEERQAAALAQLDVLAAQGLVVKVVTRPVYFIHRRTAERKYGCKLPQESFKSVEELMDTLEGRAE